MVLHMPDTLSGRVAANLRAEIVRRGMTHEEFADRMKISRQAMTNRLLLRTPISLDDLEKFAQMLEVEPAKLLAD